MALYRHQTHMRFFLTLVASLFPVALLAWNLPLWGGDMLSYDGTLLRIQQPGISKGLPAFPPFSVTCSVLSLIQVRDTETAKGFGTYCIQAPIPKHPFVGFYEGQLQNNLKDCHADDVMSLGTAFCDRYKRAQDRSVCFSRSFESL